MHGADDLVVCLSDLNVHMSKHINGFNGGHGEYGVSQKYLNGRMSPEILWRKIKKKSSTWFKRKEKMKVTSRMGENETEIDIVPTRKEHQHLLLEVNSI